MDFKKARRIEAIREDREALQGEITHKWGEDFIQQARLRLCPECDKRRDCLLFPISLDGKDCIYFNERRKA